MKKIKIETYSTPRPESHYSRDKYYWVWLGNGSKRLFSNRKHAEAFLVKTNRFLNEKIFELNRLYVEIFAEYRRLWFYFDSDRKIVSEQVDDLMVWINRKFTITIENSRNENGNFNVFRNLRQIISDLSHIINVCSDLQAQKNNWVEKYNLIVMQRRLSDIENEIGNYERSED
jgi:hypothetical protein